MSAQPQNQPLTDVDLDRALDPGSDGILPSSGFADAVMTAVVREASAPAPIPFPWKRALPGLVGILAAAVLLVVAIASVARSFAGPSPASSAASASWPLLTAALAHSGGNAQWIGLALALPLLCLLLCRRFIAGR
ncbi:MAG TPA: hypothetical protein VL990_06020 [Acidobacteriaceae bacterium]|nr:hypothetical protein [Acidobacteriaceae bacterium]